MSISSYDALRLERNGFIKYEIDELANATTLKGNPQPPINLDGEAWLATLKSRFEWTQDKEERGWSPQEIENEIMNYYSRDKRRTPFDFLRQSYKPPKKVDYLEVIRKRAQAQILEDIPDYPRKRGRSYG